MNILVTGAAGFAGKNLVAALQNIKDGKDKTHPELEIGELYLYDIDTAPALLDTYCEKADFVIHFAGVNRPENPEDFMKGNFGFSSTLLDTLKKYKNTCPVVLSSSIQATLIGRYDSDYRAHSLRRSREDHRPHHRRSGRHQPRSLRHHSQAHRHY